MATHPNALSELADVEERLREAVGKRGDRRYHVHFDDYVSDPSALSSLFDWLSENPEALRRPTGWHA